MAKTEILACKFCGSYEKLINCHIIPKSLYTPLFEGGETPEIITNVKGEYKKRSPKGVYDKGIVCGECEKKFSECDRYAAEFFLHEAFQETVLGKLNGLETILVEKFDYALLKLFGISLLWRASVSSQSLFKRISLGPHEECIKKMIEAGDPGDEDDYSIVLARFNQRELSSLIMDPISTKYSGINFYRFYFNSYCMEIKVDQRVAKYPMSEAVLSPDRPAVIFQRDFRKSKEFKVVQGLIDAEMKKKV